MCCVSLCHYIWREHRHSSYNTLLTLFRFFDTYGTLHHPNLLYLWTAMWKFVGPGIMIIIFFASVLRELIEPLTYAVYKNVSFSFTFMV